ncbi:PaREP1 family protein [Caldivirga sp.]|uniref:PaREP1 family protein n=1 Tax=Caldivirga sp. TaxID=2080243 RepID=UPI003D0F1427
MAERLKETYELVAKYINEAREYLMKGDSVQASEKLYKAAEECVKALAELNNLDEYRKSREVGRWSTQRLENAARSLARIYGDDVYTAWKIAYEKLHVRGFHEGELKPSDIEEEVNRIEELLAILVNELEGRHDRY